MKKSTINGFTLKQSMLHASGFTLLEVMLVIIMLLLVFIPLLQMIATGMSASEEVKSTNTAVMLAQKKIEEMKNSSWASITAESLTALSPAYPAYTRQVNVTDLGNLKDVRVMVLWGTGGQKADSISIETYISNF